MKPTIINVLVFLFSIVLHGQDLKPINGILTFGDAPVQDVNIRIEGTTKGTKSDASGFYELLTKPGDVLQYSHVSFNTVVIVVEDVTSTLNIELVQKTNQLKETVVTSRKKVNEALEFERIMDIDIETPYGTFNPKKSGFSVVHMKADKLNLAAPSLADALNGKFAGLVARNGNLYIRDRPVSYVMDGVQMDPRYLDFNYFEDIYIVKATATVFLITKNSPIVRQREREKTAEQYRNQNFYNDDAVEVATTASTVNDPANNSETFDTKEIFGTITYLDAPLPDVNVKIKGKATRTITDANGTYRLETEIGDEVEFTHSGFQSVSIIVEDITHELNIDMVTYTNKLDEIVVTAKTESGDVMKRSIKANESFETSRGKVNPDSAGYAVSFVDGDEVSNTYLSLKESLLGKISGYSVNPINGKAYLRGANTSVTQDYPVAWEIDGIFTTEEPIGMDLSQIKSVRALKSLAATSKYGTLGAGGVIVVKTKFGNYSSKKDVSRSIDPAYTNNNYYSDDAIVLNAEDLTANAHTKVLESFKNKGKAFRHYQAQLKPELDEFGMHIDISQFFWSHYKDKQKGVTILNDLAKTHASNPEILKAIAYNLQAMKATREAANIYKMVGTLRPNYSQSYRDLANALKENNEFKMSWRIYMNYLMNRKEDKASPVDQIVYNEMEYLYFNRESQTDIREQFVPNNESKLKFRNDVRFVVEWNTSEAEFDLEFVGPDRRAYVFEHTLAANQDLITDAKLKGYSSDEYFIEDVGTGEWLVNLTYYGNKKSAPTYFKITSYYHWGKPNQAQEISVYKLSTENKKMHLIKVNSQRMVAFNQE